MREKKQISVVLTGGGSAGHVMPHLALIPQMREKGWSLRYIGTYAIEKNLITPLGIPFHTITTGKLRRYFSWQNFFDIFRCVIGFVQSLYFLLRKRPDVVFSKGGYVSVPVCFAAWVLRIPVVTHESDLTPGLANKINIKFAKKILYSFPQTQKYLPKHSVQVNLPVRKELFDGSKAKALQICDFRTDDSRPTLLILGGSLGSVLLNNLVLQSLHKLLQIYRVIHLTGKGKKVEFSQPGSYYQQEFAGDELRDFFALAALVISRAGANSLFEYLSLAKPMILIPLDNGSRGDQIDNAKAFAEQGWAKVLQEKTLTPDELIATIATVQTDTVMKEKLALEQKNRVVKEHYVLDVLQACARA